MAESLAKIDEAVDKESRIAAIHSAERVRKMVWDNRLSRTEKAFTPDILRRIAYQEIVARLGNIRRMRDAEFALNDELRAKGVPYVERVKQINPRKIDYCDKQEARYVQMLNGFSVKPLRGWFDEIDYYSAKKKEMGGMSWVVRMKLEEIIIF